MDTSNLLNKLFLEDSDDDDTPAVLTTTSTGTTTTAVVIQSPSEIAASRAVCKAATRTGSGTDPFISNPNSEYYLGYGI